MIELATILGALAATDTGLKTVKAGAETIKALQSLVRGKSDGNELDVTTLKELIQNLRDENIGHREALQDARESLLKIKRTAESENAAVAKRALYKVVSLAGGAGGSILQLREPDPEENNPWEVCYICNQQGGLFMPLKKNAKDRYYFCQTCGNSAEY